MENNNNWSKRELALKDLFLWDENARFPDKYFNQTEEELIKYFSSRKSFKIEHLLKEIVADFDLPQLERLVVCEIEDKFVVLEGNRRVAAYKLLVNPSLSPNEKLREKITKLKADISIDDGFSLDCLITTDQREGFRFIDRKHVKSNNEVSWGEQERTHHNSRVGNATKKEEFKVGIAKIIRELDIPEDWKEKVLGPGYVTTFWRILASSIAWKEYGFDVRKDGELEVKDSSFPQKLTLIISNVLKKKDSQGRIIDSRSLNKNEAIKDYLSVVTEKEAVKVEKKIESMADLKETAVKGEVVESSIFSKKRVRPVSTRRKFLISKTCSLIIPNAKINNIYRELRDVLILDDSKNSSPNAVGVLFRVFLETSLDCFLEKVVGNKLSKEIKINKKIKEVSDYMEDNKIATKSDLVSIRRSSGAVTDILHIERFHEYVHSSVIQPESSSLKTKWDNLENFFVILWKCIADK